MSEFRITSAESDAGPRVGDSDALVRTVLFAAVFLLWWITFRPFQSLAEPQEVLASGTLANQIGYSALFLVLALWCIIHQPSRLLALMRPLPAVTILWFACCVLTSWEPALSARRFAFALVTIGIAAMVMLLPKNIRHCGEVLAGVALVVLILCYLGVLLAPQLSIHQATDYIEPELAGDWRGLFAHKNEAGATMALFVLIGLFVARVRNAVLGFAIVALASLFLVFTESKTSVAVLPLVLIVSLVMERVSRPRHGMALALTLLVAFNVVTVGASYLTPVQRLLDATMSDPTFTGRTDIWKFAVDQMLHRPITGYGFSAFWGTDEVLYGMGADAKWVIGAGHAHNGYLDLALTIGLPGMILVTLWLVVAPLADFYRVPGDPAARAVAMLFLRVCLFAAYHSCFESLFMEVGALWFFFIVAAFSLRLLATLRLAR